VGRALGRLREAGGTKSVARLQGLVNDASPEVRAEAAWALGQLPGMTTLLRRWNIEKDPRVRAALARAMGFRGSDDTVQALVAALDGAERGEAAEALGRLGAQGVVAARRNAVVAKLLDLVEDRTALSARTRAAWALGRMGLTSTSDDNLLRMRALVVVPDRVDVRANLVRAWTPLASGASRAEVLPRVAAGPPALRIAAVRAVARSPYDGAAPLVASLVSDPDAFVRREAVAALAKVKPSDPRAILAGAWTSSDPLERAAAVTALAELRSLPASPSSLLAGDLPLQVRYAAVRDKVGDSWPIASYSEFADDPAPTPAEMLSAVSFLVGDWIDESPEGKTTINYRWEDDGNFLLGDYTLAVAGMPESRSHQRIGWDPLEGVIRSWTFDSDGGFSTGEWVPTEAGWVIKSDATMPDGTTGSATVTVTPTDADHFIVRSSDRIIGGVDEPEFELTVARRPPQPEGALPGAEVKPAAPPAAEAPKAIPAQPAAAKPATPATPSTPAVKAAPNTPSAPAPVGVKPAAPAPVGGVKPAVPGAPAVPGLPVVPGKPLGK
jgi:HEAT repeat protein